MSFTISPELKKKYLIIYHSSKWAIKLAILDQVTKWWFISYLQQQQGMIAKVNSFFEFVYVWNYGISFGAFTDQYQYSNNVFIVINTLITAYLWSLLLKCKSVLSFMGYSLLIGGAIGNIIDRFYRGAVFDFIHVHYNEYSFPVFNLADSFISIGVMLIIYDYYKIKKLIEDRKDEPYNDEMSREAEKIRALDEKLYNNPKNNSINSKAK